MAVPNHREECETRVWATACRDCGESVFFFSCTCGSKVFFDLPHPPWNPHEDRCVPYLIRYLREVEKRSSSAIRLLVHTYALERGLAVPRAIERVLAIAQNGERGTTTILDIHPSEDPVHVCGKLHAIDSINLVRRTRIPPSAIGRKLLGRLAEEAYVEVRIREPRDAQTGFVNQFTFLVTLTRWENARLRVEDDATVYLRSQRLPNHERAWVADEVLRARVGRVS